MADVPDGIFLRRDRDLAGREWEMWLRRGPFALVPIFALHGIDDVEWGILETNGPISFVKKK